MKLSNKNKVSRLAIFFFYDKDGVVDDYIDYLLEDMKKNIDELLVVCNGKLTSEGREKFNKLADKLLVRENKGFDVWAYKEGIEYLGWDHIEKYDELIMFNFTIFGPLYPFKEMFDEMDNQDVDFWGITKYHKTNFDPFGTISYGYIPEHIQSHFIAVRKNMLSSYEFRKYWKDMNQVTRYEEAIGYHEAIFTKKFNDKGFTSQTYINTEDLSEHCFGPIIMKPLELIKNRSCPIIKRRSFFHGYEEILDNTSGEVTLEAYKYIEKELEYDTNLIWNNILRCQNQADIKRNLHLNYILSSEYTKNDNIISYKNNIALIMHIYFEDLIEYCLEYAKSMPTEADIYITTDTEKKRRKILKEFCKIKFNNLDVRIIENRGRDVSALLVGCKDIIMDYDYICFAHDKKVTQLKPYSKGESFSYKCFENILKSKEYVRNIINTFEENPKLGLLTPPPPNHSDYFPTIGLEWTWNIEQTKNLAEELDINVDINWDNEPIAPLGTMFWFRSKALKKLIEYDWEYKDFPKEPNKIDATLLHAIERIYPYIVQDEGYYPAWVMCDTFAAIELTNLNYMLRKINCELFKNYGPNSHYGMVQILRNQYNSKIIIKKYIKDFILTKFPKPIISMLKKIKKIVKR